MSEGSIDSWQVRAEAAEKLIRELPMCAGEWLRGSGGHKVYSHDCDKIATWISDDDPWNEATCDAHHNPHDYNDEALYADEVRAYYKAIEGVR